MEYTPHQYQILAKKYILKKDRMLLEFRQGMGKKSIVLSGVKELIDKGEINKTLILVPSIYKMRKWIKEVELWNHLKCLNIVTISGKDRNNFININGSDIYITHRENIAWLVNRKEFMFDMIIIDDIDLFSNPKSLRYKKMLDICTSVKKIIGIMHSKQNMELRLWDVMYILDRGERLGKNKDGFWDRFFFSYMDKNNKSIHRELKKDSKKSIYRILKDIIVNEDCVGKESMPRKIYTKTELELDAVELSKYMYLSCNDVHTDELRQLANGCIEIKGHRFVLHKKKINELRAICEDCNEDMVIIYQYDSDLKHIKENIANIKVIQSMHDVQKWNDGNYKCIVINAEFGGIENRFNLRGERVVWYSLPGTFNLYVNMNRRFNWEDNRNLIIHNLVVKDTIDEVIYGRISE